MAQSKKYAGLLDLDQAPEIYETPDLTDDASTNQTATLRTSSPSPSDDDSRHDPDAGLDRQHLDRDGARRLFEHSTVDAQDVNFSDSLASNRKSYKVFKSENESLSGKLARLRREAEEIKLELEKRKEGYLRGDEPDDEGAMEDGVVKLSEMLDNLHTDSKSINGTTFTAGAALSRQLHRTTPSAVDSGGQSALRKSENHPAAQAPPASTTTAIAAFADRLSSLESALGLASMPTTTDVTSVFPALTSLSNQITTLTTTLASPSPASNTSTSSFSRSQTSTSIPHLDALASRLRSLTSESDKLAASRKRALESLHDLQEARLRHPASFPAPPTQSDPPREQVSSLFEDSSAKIAALYATLPTIQDLQPLLPVVLERLRSLQVLHADAAGAKGELEEVEKQQAALSHEIERWRKGLTDVEAKMVEYQKVTGKNTEVISRMVEDVEERLARLETQ